MPTCYVYYTIRVDGAVLSRAQFVSRDLNRLGLGFDCRVYWTGLEGRFLRRFLYERVRTRFRVRITLLHLGLGFEGMVWGLRLGLGLGSDIDF